MKQKRWDDEDIVIVAKNQSQTFLLLLLVLLVDDDDDDNSITFLFLSAPSCFTSSSLPIPFGPLHFVVDVVVVLPLLLRLLHLAPL